MGSFAAGVKAAIERPGLAGLLYGFKLVLALTITLPLYLVLGSTTALSGFSAELAQTFDITLWMDILDDALVTIQAMQVQLLWIVPLFLLWKTAYSVGLIATLHARGLTGFWQGVGDHTGRAVLLAFIFLVPLIALVIGLVIVGAVLRVFFSGEIGAFWVFVVTMPVLVVLGLAVLDLMHDYARMELVVARKPRPTPCARSRA